MGLTRPKIWDLDTNIEYFMDPITVLHQGATQANVDVGFLFNRANGLVSNVAVYWSEASQSIVTAFTNNTGSTNSNVVTTGYANLTIGSLLSINGNIYLNGVMGTPGQFITATNAGVAWTATPFTGGYIANQSTFGSNLVANSATASTSTTTGALVVTGGAGISGNLYVGGNIYSNNTISSSITAVLTHGTDNNFQLSAQNGVNSNATGTEVARFGVNYAGSTGWDTFTQYIRGSSAQTGWIGTWAANTFVSALSSTQVNVVPSTSSTSTTTGAFVVAGGAGVGGNLYVGTNLNVTGTLTRGSATATEISTVTTSIGTSPTSIDSFANTAIRGAKYVISVQDVVNSQSQVSEILLAQDGANVNITSYGVVYTGPTQRMTFSSNISSGTVTLWATGVSTNNTVKLSRTALPM
jgi:hypothetical protein